MHRRRLVGPGRVALEKTLISLQDLRRTIFYTDFLRPYDTVHLCGIALHSGDNQFAAMSLLRPERAGPHGDPELALANAVAPHMRRAARIAGLLEGASPIAPDFEALAEKLSFGLLLLGAKAELLYANPRAEALLRKGLLKVLTGRIMVAAPADSEMISGLIDQVLKVRQASAMILDGLDTGPVQLLATPLPKRSRDFAVLAQRAEVAVLLLDAVGENRIPREIIGRLYGLTPAESRIAEALLAGISPANFADRIGVSRNTVKTQMRTVYSKVGVSSHSGPVGHMACLTSLRP